MSDVFTKDFLYSRKRKKWLDSLKPGDRVLYCYGNSSLPPFSVKIERVDKTFIHIKSDVKFFTDFLNKKTGAVVLVDKHTYMFIQPLDAKVE